MKLDKAWGYIYLLLGFFFLIGAIFPPFILYFDNFGISYLAVMLIPDAYGAMVLLVIVSIIVYNFSKNEILLKFKYQYLRFWILAIMATILTAFVPIPPEFSGHQSLLRLSSFLGFFFLMEGISHVYGIKIIADENEQPKPGNRKRN